MQNDPRLPRGYRNNNPLNIRFNSHNNWTGKILPNTDGVFEQFRTPEYGYRAALKLIQNYIKAGTNTVAAIISKWAPNNENNTTNYINRVCTMTQFVPSTVLSANDKESLCKLVYAMAIVENGIVSSQPVMAEIEDGWSMLLKTNTKIALFAAAVGMFLLIRKNKKVQQPIVLPEEVSGIGAVKKN